MRVQERNAVNVDHEAYAADAAVGVELILNAAIELVGR